jgi:hypothetical protein
MPTTNMEGPCFEAYITWAMQFGQTSRMRMTKNPNPRPSQTNLATSPDGIEEAPNFDPVKKLIIG